jgi:hypothetical protein
VSASPTLLAAALLTAACGARAAGGHFDVDDATMLDDGRCQVELWAFDGRTPRAELLHAGSACHWGGIEWGLNADRIRIDGERDDTLGPQAKWVMDIVDKRLAAGVVLAAAWRTAASEGPILNAYVPVSAWVGPVQMNFNLGRDHDPRSGSFRRWGAGADWTLNDQLMLTLERRSLFAQAVTRAGVRYSLTPHSSIDASVARAGGLRLFGIGFNVDWAR